ncbi:MAG: LytR/AlgR family response regulator transcription factor [Wujia sp.]
MNLEIAILEDNNQDFIHISSILTKWGQQTGNVINISRFKDEEILEEFANKNYDLLFTDIELKDSKKYNGIHICEKLREQGYNNEIIFLTAFSEYVFQGYNVRAFNYLVKPISLETLSSCLKKFIDIHKKNYYCLQDRSFLLQIRFNDILYIEKQNHNILFHTKGKDYYERTTLTNIINKLPSHFLQCHKSCIINMTHVMSIMGNEVHLSDGSVLSIGRNYLSEIRNALLDLYKL